MKIGLQTWGSHGDVEPFMALAEGLAERGHEVRLVVTTQGDKELRAPDGVRLDRVGRSMTQAEGDDLFDRVIALGSPMAQGKLVLQEGFMPFADDMFEAARDLVDDCDLIVRHHFLYMTQVAAELAGVPEVSVFLTPDLLPTKEHPPTGMPSLGPLQGVAWWMANKGVSSIFGPPAQALRAKMGLPESKGVLNDVWVSSTANLVAVSPTLFERPGDWPETHHLTGFWRAPSASTLDLDPELDAFIDAGEPPVYATFGSMSSGSGERRRSDTELLVGAARLAGRRLILQQPAGDEPELDGGDDVMSVTRAPHSLVFGRCAAVVHHGGAGTTQTAVLAGAPSVIVPHLADQFFWAAQVAKLGVGVASKARSKVRSAALSQAIETAVRDESLGANASGIAAQLSAEDGVARAVSRIEQVQ